MPANRRPPVYARSAFTLVELLVVIAVLGILAGLLLPVLASARESARRTGCMTYLRQIGIALQAYVDDHDGSYPVPPLEGNAEEDEDEEEEEGLDQDPDWEEVIQPYMRTEAIFRCPSDPSPAELFDMSYTLNAAFAMRLHESAVRYPSTTIIVADRRNSLANQDQQPLFLWWLWQGNVWPPRAEPDPAPAATRDLALDRHAGRLNVLYADGRVRCVLFPSTWGEGHANQYWPQRP